MVYDQVAGTADQRAQVSAWIRKTFAPALAELASPAESDWPIPGSCAPTSRILGTDGKDDAVITKAREIARKYMADPESVDATLGQTAIAIAARKGDAELFDALQHVYETNTNPEFQEGALRLMAEFENPALLTRISTMQSRAKSATRTRPLS